MAKKRTAEFDEWCDGASDEDLDAMAKATSKKFWIWFLISLIPVVNFVTMGFAIFCYNNLSYIKSRGRSNGSNLLRFILMLYALYIPPIIVVNICSKNDKLGSSVLGW